MANPAAVVQAGSLIASGQSPMPTGRPLRAWQFRTRSAMSHIPFKRAAAGKNHAFHQVLLHAGGRDLLPRKQKQLLGPRLKNFVHVAARGACAGRSPSGVGTSIRLLSAVRPSTAQPYCCLIRSASSIDTVNRHATSREK